MKKIKFPMFDESPTILTGLTALGLVGSAVAIITFLIIHSPIWLLVCILFCLVYIGYLQDHFIFSDDE